VHAFQNLLKTPTNESFIQRVRVLVQDFVGYFKNSAYFTIGGIQRIMDMAINAMVIPIVIFFLLISSF
jgi:hypothetical protein